MSQSNSNLSTSRGSRRRRGRSRCSTSGRENQLKLPSVFLLVVTLLALFIPTIRSFTPPQQQQQLPFIRTSTTSTTGSTSTSLSMIGNFLGGATSPQNNNKKSSTDLPRNVKDAVSKCRAAVQQALGDRCSRMDIEMPVGAKFGVEKTTSSSSSAGKTQTQSNTAAPTRDMLDQSNRELARLFVEMFQPVGGEHIAVVFNDQGLADQAKKRWKGDPTAASRIMAIDRKKGGNNKKQNKKKSKGMGFAAKLAAEVEDVDDRSSATPTGGPFALPDNCEVAIFVAPGHKELATAERICNDVGMGTLVILLNARLGLLEDKFPSERAQTLFQEEFEPVFCLTAAPQEQAPGCLMYRMYPTDWVVARKPKVGPPKPILTQSEKPNKEQCRTAFESLEMGDMEKGMENVLENVAQWFN